MVTFGGYVGGWPRRTTSRCATSRSCASITGSATTASAPTTDHAIYVRQAAGGPHDLLFEDITVDGRGGLASAVHLYGSDAGNPNAWNVTVRRLTVTGTQQAIILWNSTLHDIVIDGATITGALASAVRYEQPGTAITLANISSTGSGEAGFQSSYGSNPPGVTFIGNSFR